MANIEINVTGITCGGCEKSIRNALLEKNGVIEVNASHESGIVKIDFDDDAIQPDMLKQTIEAAGFDVVA